MHAYKHTNIYTYVWYRGLTAPSPLPEGTIEAANPSCPGAGQAYICIRVCMRMYACKYVCIYICIYRHKIMHEYEIINNILYVLFCFYVYFSILYASDIINYSTNKQSTNKL